MAMLNNQRIYLQVYNGVCRPTNTLDTPTWKTIGIRVQIWCCDMIDIIIPKSPNILDMICILILKYQASWYEWYRIYILLSPSFPNIWDISLYNRKYLGYLGISWDIYIKKKKHIKPIPAARRLTDLRTYHLRKKKTSTSNSPWDWGGSLFSHKPDCFYHHVAVKIVIQTGWRLWSRASRNIRFSPMGIAYNGIFLRCLQSHLVDINMSLKNPVARIRCLKKDSFTHFASVNLVWM